MSYSERQIGFKKGGNFTLLTDYLDKIKVKEQPFNTAGYISPSAVTFMGLLVAKFPGSGEKLKICLGTGTMTAFKGGVIAASGAWTAGTAAFDATTVSDANGNILNLVDIRYKASNDPVIDTNGKKVWGLLTAATGIAEGTAIHAATANIEISFVVYGSSDTLEAAAGGVTGDIEFRINRAYAERWQITGIEKEGGIADVEVISDLTTKKIAVYTVDTGTSAGNSVLTVSTGALTNSGATTKTGDTVTLAAEATFNSNNFVIYDNEGNAIKGVDVSYSDADAITIIRQLDAGDVIRLENKE